MPSPDSTLWSWRLFIGLWCVLALYLLVDIDIRLKRANWLLEQARSEDGHG